MNPPFDFAVGSGIWAVDVPAEKLVTVSRTEVDMPTSAPAELLRAALADPIGLNVPCDGPSHQTIVWQWCSTTASPTFMSC